ncbi:LOW QUALITY PROTEIN: hypothetical protein QTO34_008084 [Cnephaeus nilssonii]|uniref:RNase H type-1 domain-containing protein n=1 Tax=Cnephaeus nilssonii TaxID=3371016 RepID=A0AA40I9N6_CNENI|nr:LOW QUALITY PROTEIN: hypothetical protein QTO34_008084 [Eptesicus nilssonii]
MPQSPCSHSLFSQRGRQALPLGQNLNVKVPHAVITLMEAKGQHWLTHAQMTQYLGLLCENPQIRLEAVRTPNPATFLPIKEGTPERDCLEVLEEVYSRRPDLTDRSLQNPDLVLFTDGKAQALREGWSAQRAELWAPVRVLNLSKDKHANIYTDSRYAFTTLHSHGAIYKERGLLTAREKGIKNQNEILKLLEAIWEPREGAVIHCRGHQKGKDSVSEGNRRADAAARLAAKEPVEPLWIMLVPELPEPLKYTPQEKKWAQREGGTAVHPHKPGDQVWVKDWKKEPLKPTWKGPYSTPQLSKTEHLDPPLLGKSSHQLDNQQPEWKVTSDLNHPLQIIFKKTVDPPDRPEFYPDSPSMNLASQGLARSWGSAQSGAFISFLLENAGQAVSRPVLSGSVLPHQTGVASPGLRGAQPHLDPGPSISRAPGHVASPGPRCVQPHPDPGARGLTWTRDPASPGPRGARRHLDPGSSLTQTQGRTASPGPRGALPHPDPGAHGLTRTQGRAASPGPGGVQPHPGPGPSLIRTQGRVASPGPRGAASPGPRIQLHPNPGARDLT